MRSRLLLISAAANAAFVILAIYLLFLGSNYPFSSGAATNIPASGPAKASVAEPSPAPFRWDQIESADYRTYIANLRSAGCPEETIRDIITADIARLYRSKDRDIETKLRQGQLDEAAARSEIADLEKERTSLLLELFGPDASPDRPITAISSSQDKVSPGSQNAAAAPVSQDKTAAPAQTDEPRIDHIDLPVALMPPDPGWQLDDDQAAILQRLKQQFIDAIGGANQDPANPAYLQRWQEAQPVFDTMFEQQFGTDAYLAQKRRADAAVANSQ